MKINKITPQGYCGGVINALNIVNNTINDASIPRPIYLLGNIIHNKHVVNDLKKKGIIVIDNKNKTRLELLDLIDSGTVIFSAHGVSPEVYLKAKEKGLFIVDAVCPNVNIVHKNIKRHLDDGYCCLYVGTSNHPECEGVLGIDKRIKFISSVNDINSLDISNDKIYVTNQTTLSKYDLEDIYIKLKNKYPNIYIDDKICNATTIRQEAMANQEKVDLCIVVGDKESSNTKKLANVSQNIAGIKTILCEDLKSLDKNALENINCISISSGASTPSHIVDEIIEYLKQK